MTEQVQPVEVEVIVEEKNGVVERLSELAHKTMLVGWGAVGYTQDALKKGWEESSEFAHKLVERGENMSEERRQQLIEEREKRQEQIQDQAKDMRKKVEEQFDHYTEVVLSRANLASHNDIQELSKQISALSRKLDKVRKEQEKVA